MTTDSDLARANDPAGALDAALILADGWRVPIDAAHAVAMPLRVVVVKRVVVTDVVPDVRMGSGELARFAGEGVDATVACRVDDVDGTRCLPVG